MTDVANPYSVPKAKVADLGTGAEAEALREAHIATEASIRSFGLLYYLAFAGCAMTGLAVLADVERVDGPRGAIAIFAIALGGIFVAVGYGLRKLKPWVRIPAIMLAGLGLLGFPVGTLINGYFLYLLLCVKGRFILSTEYADVVAATPHVRYRTAVWLLVLVGVVILGIIAAIALPMLSR